MKKTYRDIIVFANIAARWAQEHKELSRFGYALAKVAKQIAKFIEAYQDAGEDLRVEHCAVDKDGHILKENNEYVFTKDGRKALDKASRALLATEVDVTPFLVTVTPDELPVDVLLALEGFVLAEGYTDAKMVDPSPAQA